MVRATQGIPGALAYPTAVCCLPDPLRRHLPLTRGLGGGRSGVDVCGQRGRRPHIRQPSPKRSPGSASCVAARDASTRPRRFSPMRHRIRLRYSGSAALALDQDRPSEARQLADRYSRRVPPRDCTGRIAALDLLVRAASALSDRATATATIDELRAIATKLATHLIRAMTASSSGVLAMADGDWNAARTAFEDAIDLFMRAGLPFGRHTPG